MAAPGSNKPDVGDILVVIRKFVFSSSHRLTQRSFIKEYLFSSGRVGVSKIQQTAPRSVDAVANLRYIKRLTRISHRRLPSP